MPYFTDIMSKLGRPAKTEAPPFGRRLATLRTRYGLTQRELAERLSVTQKTIDYYERRARKPSIELLVKLAQAFDTTTDELLGLPPKAVLPAKPGPAPQLEQRLEQLRKLPKAQQKTVLVMIDGLLHSHSETADA